MHEPARRFYEELVTSGERLLTTNYVVDETATRLRYDAGLEAALAFRDALERSVSQRRLRVIWVDRLLEREGWGILERYGDVALSLTDATSAAAAKRAKVQDVFGFDADFRALGFTLRPLG
jgi:uncharacterized protein